MNVANALCWFGAWTLLVWLLADGWTRVRAVGHVVLVLTGPLTRPIRTLYRRLDEPPSATCARRGHRVAWDGHAEFCRRCGVDSYPDTKLSDPTVQPRRLRWNVHLTDEEVEGLINDLDSRLRDQLARADARVIRRLDELRRDRRDVNG